MVLRSAACERVNSLPLPAASHYVMIKHSCGTFKVARVGGKEYVIDGRETLCCELGAARLKVASARLREAWRRRCVPVYSSRSDGGRNAPMVREVVASEGEP